jgi:hypothetical protein
LAPRGPIVSANAETLTEGFYVHLFDMDETAARLFAGLDAGASATAPRTGAVGRGPHTSMPASKY